jgi:hypothetical protein
MTKVHADLNYAKLFRIFLNNEVSRIEIGLSALRKTGEV